MRSLKRPTLAVWMLGTIAAISWWDAWVAYDMNQVSLVAYALAAAVPATYVAQWFFIARLRLRAVWRTGVCAEITLGKSVHFWTGAYRYRVELDDGRWAIVILRAAADVGTRLPALVDGNLIAVSDFGGCLKPGRLRRAPQPVARVV